MKNQKFFVKFSRFIKLRLSSEIALLELSDTGIFRSRFGIREFKVASLLRATILPWATCRRYKELSIMLNKIVFSLKKSARSTSKTMSSFANNSDFVGNSLNLHYTRILGFFKKEIVFSLRVRIKSHRYPAKSWEILKRISENLRKSSEISENFRAEFFKETFTDFQRNIFIRAFLHMRLNSLTIETFFKYKDSSILNYQGFKKP